MCSTASFRSPTRSRIWSHDGRAEGRQRGGRGGDCRKLGSVSEPRPRISPRPDRAAGLYDPAYEHDACGVACVARLDGQPRHDVIDLALDALDDLEHRGAAGADPT